MTTGSSRSIAVNMPPYRAGAELVAWDVTCSMLLTADDIHAYAEALPSRPDPIDWQAAQQHTTAALQAAEAELDAVRAVQDGMRAGLADARSELSKAEDEAERLRAELDLLRPLADAAQEYLVELERAHVSGSSIGADDALDALAESVEAYVAAYPVE